jgi:SSS family solute:Na+ symporter
MHRVSALAAKSALLFGLVFYIFMTWIYTDHKIHFVHIWGIEFLLNVAIMYAVSYFYPRKNDYRITDVGAVDLTPWRYTKPMSIVLCGITILIYILLGRN